MLDEWAERLADRLCEQLPAFLRPHLIALSNSALGWRINLYVGTAVRTLTSLAKQVHTEEGLERFLEEMMARKSGAPYLAMRAKRAFASCAFRFRRFCQKGRFVSALLLCQLAALCVTCVGGAQAAACAASLMILWLSVAMEEEYQPISGGVRQKYLASALLRGVCMLPLLMRYFMDYASRGVANNVVLQGTMIVMLFVHLAFFVPLIALNRLQSPLLRALSGILGTIPALTASAAVAAAFSAMGGEPATLLGALLGALGAVAAFAGEEVAAIVTLGGIRLKHQYIYMFVLTTAGFTLMLAGAWSVA